MFINPRLQSMMQYPVQSNRYSAQYQKAFEQFKLGRSRLFCDQNPIQTNNGLMELAQALQADLTLMKSDIQQIKSRLNIYG
jgi:hypothetical protein